MANRRSYTDDQLRNAIASATSWAEVMELLGKTRKANAQDVRRTAERMGLDASHFRYPRGQDPHPGAAVPFSRQSKPGGKSGLSTAARWFLDRGYVVSVPMEAAPYDLITESDDGLKKVQIKTTAKLTAGGRYMVKLVRTIYDPTRPANAAGHYRQVAYDPGMVDLFFIIANGTGGMYLIPFDEVRGLQSIVLDKKYQAFKVE